ncbi:MAG: outer membrane protein assembly factor BamD [Desulfuromonadales bacterium]|nr:outer membrane protein assembly factor BamD [Desulfuromonadales bacterium]
MKHYLKAAFCAVMTAVLLQGCAAVKPNGPSDEMFKQGEASFKKGDYEDAIAYWKKVKESYQSPELTTRAEIGIADAYFLNKDFIEAAVAYEDFRKLHPNHERAGFALYRQALSHFNQISGIDTDQTPVKNAMITFQSYLRQYPGGEYTAEVNEKIRDCRDKQFQYEIYVGRFYQRTGKDTAAIARFEEALKTFKELPRCGEALYYLGRTYQDAKQPAKARETFERLVKEYPGSTFVSLANKETGK